MSCHNNAIWQLDAPLISSFSQHCYFQFSYFHDIKHTLVKKMCEHVYTLLRVYSTSQEDIYNTLIAKFKATPHVIKCALHTIIQTRTHTHACTNTHIIVTFPRRSSMNPKSECCFVWGMQLICWMLPLVTKCHTHYHSTLCYLRSKIWLLSNLQQTHTLTQIEDLGLDQDGLSASFL